MYYLYKCQEKRVGAGKWPDVIREYATALPPILETSLNPNDAMLLDKEEAENIARLIGFEIGEARK